MQAESSANPVGVSYGLMEKVACIAIAMGLKATFQTENQSHESACGPRLPNGATGCWFSAKTRNRTVPKFSLKP